jgi:Rad3-related DNA helicase
MDGVAGSQRIQLIVCVRQRLTKHLQEFLQEMSVRLDNLENLVERHRDNFGSLKRHGAVLTLLSGSTQLPDNITGFADIVDEFVATFRDASDFHKPLLEEEKRLVFVRRIVNYLIFFEGCHGAIPQDDIAELSSKCPCQCRGERPVMGSQVSG